MPRDNRIKVYRSTQGVAPPSFTSDPAVGPTFGEFAFSDGINSLFMGKDDGSVLWVGAQVTGGDIGQGLTTAVPTQKAVKDYVTSVSSGYWIVRDENGLTHQIDLTDTLTLTGGAGVDVLKSSDTDTLIIKGVTATSSTLGVASFSTTHFGVVGGAVSLTSGPMFTVRDEKQSSVSVSWGDVLTLTGGPGINVFTDGATDRLAIQGVTATSSVLGIASFRSGDFTIASGQVSLTSGIVNSVNGRTGNVSLPLATTTGVTGVASFSSDNFNVSSGAVTTKNISIEAQDNASLGPILAGLGSSFTITGSNGVKTKLIQLPVPEEPFFNATALSVEGINATYTQLGVSRFSSTWFEVSDGLVSLTSGPIFTVRDEKNATWPIAAGDTLTLTGGRGVDVIRSAANGAFVFEGITATDTTLGVASFKAGDFVVTSGAVSLTSGIVNSVNGLTGAVTVVSVLPLANTTGTTGVAAFNANYFSVSATGTVSLTTVDGGTWP